VTLPHRASLDRARRELATLADAERAYLATTPYRLVHAHDVRGGRYAVRVQVARPVPDEIASQAAGVVRTLRESLDQLATSLAGTPARFPVFESLVLFAQRARKAIAPMSDDAQAFLEELQPYHAIGGFRNGALWILQQLDAEEPLRLAAGGVRSGVMGDNTQRDVTMVGEPVVATGPFADGAVVASVATRVAGPDPKLDMFLRAEFALAFAGGGPARGREVVELLHALCDHVEHTVLPVLEPTLPPRG
jgi:hypothetical protein